MSAIRVRRKCASQLKARRCCSAAPPWPHAAPNRLGSLRAGGGAGGGGLGNQTVQKAALEGDLDSQDDHHSAVCRLSEQEGQVQERLWGLEDEIATLQTLTYNAQEICDRLTEFMRTFPTLMDCERKLLDDSLITEVALKHKEVAVTLTPPLASLGFFSPSLAPKEEKRNNPELIIYLVYNLATYSGAGLHGITRVGTTLSRREYALRPPQPSSQAVQASAVLRGLVASALQAAGAVCATAQAL